MHHIPAIDVDGLAGDVLALLAGQEDGHRAGMAAGETSLTLSGRIVLQYDCSRRWRKAMTETTGGIQASSPLLSPVETEVNGSNPSPSAHDEQTGQTERLRGVVALPHDRPILLTDEVELDPCALPRWRPQINLDNRRIDDDE